MTALAPVMLMLRHEARLNWRSMPGYSSSWVKIAGMVCVVVFMHLLAVLLPLAIMTMPPLPRLTMLMTLSVFGLFVMMMMISVTLLGTVKLIYSRDDMDLLLSSPVPPLAIVLTRVLAIALGVF